MGIEYENWAEENRGTGKPPVQIENLGAQLHPETRKLLHGCLEMGARRQAGANQNNAPHDLEDK